MREDEEELVDDAVCAEGAREQTQRLRGRAGGEELGCIEGGDVAGGCSCNALTSFF